MKSEGNKTEEFVNICKGIHSGLPVYKYLEKSPFFNNGALKIKNEIAEKGNEGIKMKLTLKDGKTPICAKMGLDFMMVLESIVGLPNTFERYLDSKYIQKKKGLKAKTNQQKLVETKPSIKPKKEVKEKVEKCRRRKTLAVLQKRSKGSSRRANRKRLEFWESKNDLKNKIASIIKAGNR